MKRFFLFFTLLALLSSCGKDENEGGGGNTGGGNNPNTPSTQTSITISPSALTFDAQGEKKSVTVTCTAGKTWALSGGESWCTASATSGSNGATVTFTAEANPSPDERNATYTFTCGDKTAKLVATQKQQDALTVTSSKVEVDAQGGPINVEVKANIPFEYAIADKDKGWITPMETKSMQTTVLTFNVAQNEDREKREGTITIKSGELSETVTIYQAGEQPTIVISQNTYEISGDGETIKVEINSNVDFKVSIPDAYSAWIRAAAEPRAFSTHTKYFTISVNPLKQSRTGEIILTNTEHNLLEKITINQKSGGSYISLNVPQAETLASVLAENKLEIESIGLLKIIGVLNDEDFLILRDMTNLRGLDLAEVNLPVFPEKALYQQKIEHLILPNVLTSIGKSSFGALPLNSIVLPSTLVDIGNSAFAGCKYLTSIAITANIESIGDNAFGSCNSLTDITFESGSKLKTIGESAFTNNRALTTVKIPANVETIGAYAFWDCSALTSVTFETGSKLGLINKHAFSKCIALTSIEIPAKVQAINSAAFQNCTALTTVTFESGSQLDAIYGDYSFYDNHNTKDQCKLYGAFSGCTALTSINIPASVRTLGTTVFQGCSALTKVTFETGSQLRTIPGAAEEDKYAQPDNPIIPYHWEVRQCGLFADCISLTSIEIPENVQTIQPCAFCIWFDHGRNPSDAAYAYILLPNRSAAQTAAYSAAPDAEILANTPQVQAVHFKDAAVTGLNFWQPSANPVAGVSADAPASVTMREDKEGLTIGVSDPTQLNTGKIRITLDRAVGKPVKENPKIRVLSTSPLSFEADVKDALGATREIRFASIQ